MQDLDQGEPSRFRAVGTIIWSRLGRHMKSASDADADSSAVVAQKLALLERLLIRSLGAVAIVCRDLGRELRPSGGTTFEVVTTASYYSQSVADGGTYRTGLSVRHD